MNAEPSTIAILRGLRAAVVGGLGGAIVPVALLCLFTVCRWFIEGASDFDRQLDLNNLPKKLHFPIIGCSLMCACAAWTTFAPCGNFRFAKSLAIIFAICMPLWYILSTMHLTPQRLKGVHHPAIYPSELIVVIGPPIVAAVFLTAIRIFGSRRPAGSESRANSQARVSPGRGDSQ